MNRLQQENYHAGDLQQLYPDHAQQSPDLLPFEISEPLTPPPDTISPFHFGTEFGFFMDPSHEEPALFHNDPAHQGPRPTLYAWTQFDPNGHTTNLAYQEHSRPWVGSPRHSSPTSTVSMYDSSPRVHSDNFYFDNHAAFNGSPLSPLAFYTHGHARHPVIPQHAHEQPTVTLNSIMPFHHESHESSLDQIHTPRYIGTTNPDQHVGSYENVQSMHDEQMTEDADTDHGVEANEFKQEVSSPLSGSSSQNDSDYKPGATGRTKQRKGSRSSAKNKSTATSNSPSKVGKSLSPTTSSRRGTKTKGASPTTSDDNVRPFPCSLRPYGCMSTFKNKNEWKRHIRTQHVSPLVFRCDQCPDYENHPNIFNRKDLFKQHLMRLHPESLNLGSDAPHSHTHSHDRQNSTKGPIHATGGGGLNSDIYTRCQILTRQPPPHSQCVFCNEHFYGQENSWEMWLEHTGHHLSTNAKTEGPIEPGKYDSFWSRDSLFRNWLVDAGFLVGGRGSTWKLSDKSKTHSRDYKKSGRTDSQGEEAEGEAV